ncbi:putative LPS assembly protein LptD [Candidatus Neomarinimicrobiota bacterium]
MKRITLLLILFSYIFAQDERLRLEHADLLENITSNNVSIQLLTGNVKFTKGEVILTCDRARFNEQMGQNYLYGNVTVFKKTMTMSSDSMTFDSPNDLLKGFSNVKVWDEDYSLTSDSLFYYTELDSGIAHSRVNLNQNEQRLLADHVIYSKPAESEEASYWANGNVFIRDNEISATCGELDYSSETETAFLRINPQVKENNRILYGEEIEIHSKDKKLNYLFIPGKAQALALHNRDEEGLKLGPAEFKNNMTGNVLHAYFADSKLDSIRLEGMATTLYHVYDDSVFQGINETSGDTMRLIFINEELNRILVDGGAQGIFTPDSTHESITASIDYKSDILHYEILSQKSDLHGNARIKYGDIDLNAGYVGIHWDTNLLRAFPASELDTTLEEIRPTLLEQGREPLVGNTMVYNLYSRKGRVTLGRTKAEDGYYAGQEIRNIKQDVFYMEQSSYTTCDLEQPHFHFGSRKMKMIHNDKVVAKPLFLYINDIPIFGIPFAVLPHQGGARHSGWIMPGYGENRRRGQYLDGFGYYWAPNPYWDTKLLFSIADRQGITLKGYNRYKNRYKYDGNFHVEARRFLASGEKNITQIGKNYTTDYVLKWNHQQKMRYNQSLNVNASYYSNSEYNYTTALDPIKRMNQQAISNATYSKRWPKSGNSLSINLSSNRDLMVDRKIDSASTFYQKPTTDGAQLNSTTNTLPKISFRHGQSALIPTKSSDKNWYHNITWDYSSNFTNKSKTFYKSVSLDSIDQFIWDTESNGSSRLYSLTDNLLAHSISISAPQKIFRYITVSPRFSLDSDWVPKTFSGRLDSTDNVHTDRVDEWAFRTTGALSVNAKTQIYGMFPISFRKLRGIRHVVSPSVGFTYAPDFSEPLFGKDLGYFEELVTPDGDVILHDRFANTLAGGTSHSKRQSLNFSLNNIFQAKLQDEEVEQKVDLFSWQMSTNYNFAAEEFQLSNLQSSLRASLAKLNLDLSMTHDFYQYDIDNNRRLNSLKFNAEGIPVPRLINARLSTGFKFEGKKLKPVGTADTELDTMVTEDSLFVDELDDFGQNNSLELVNKPLESATLWSTNLNLSYAYNNSNPSNPTKTFWLNGNSSIQVTKNWRVQHTARFDLIKKTMVSQSFSIYRDLHCWEMSIAWTPGGFGQGLYLKINVKSPSLEDLKIEEKGGIYQTQALY